MKPYILIITMHADPAMPPGYGEWGGTHTYMRELLDCLDDYGLDCVLITRQSMEELPAKEQYRPHCTIYRLQNGPAAPMPKTDLILYHEENLTKLQEIIENCGGRPLAIHSVYWNSGRLGMALSKKYGIPLVHSVISNSRGRVARGAKEPMLERAGYEQKIYKYAKWILCVSEDEKNDLIRYYQIAPEKLIVAGQYIHSCFITPARDHNGFPRLNSTISSQAQQLIAERYNQIFCKNSTDSFWAHKAFTYFGRIAQDKGVDHILRAWHQLNQKYQSLCPPLWLIGGSLPEIEAMRKDVKAEISELDALEHSGKLVWWGCLDPSGASTLLLKTLVLVTNSLYEPGGRVVTEAMSEGIPVIASPNGFARDLICDWENGFLVEHGDEKALRDRMEHFLRQPFLSNTLGRRARETAERVIQNWDFLGRHLHAYGEKPISAEVEKPFKEERRPRQSLHLYPFGNVPLHPELLRSFFMQQTQQEICSGPEPFSMDSRSELYKIQGKAGQYIIKRPVSCLAASPLFVPLCQGQYAHTAGDRYRLEKSAYQAAHSDILVGTDSFHQLLLLRAAEPKPIDKAGLPSISAFLAAHTTVLPPGVPERFLATVQRSQLDTIAGLDQLLNRLSGNFPDFYFAPSGIFLPYVGWQIAPHILRYNMDNIETADMGRLQRICADLRSRAELPPVEKLREINADTELRHIMQIDGRWVVIDREHRTIGTSETQVAACLFSWFLRDPQAAWNWGDVFDGRCPEGCDQAELLLALSYRLFYDATMHAVLRDAAIEPFLNALEGLTEK